MMPTRPVLAQALPLLPSLERRLRERYEVHAVPAAGPAREAFVAAHGARIEGLVTSASFGVGADVIDALPVLRVISSFGVGLDRIDLAAAHRRGIAVGYTPDVLNDCVADMAFGLMLAVARRLSAADRFVRGGAWAQRAAFPLGRQVCGARLGIVGLGRIGRTIARRASGFEMEVRYNNRRPVDGVAWAHEPDLFALARWCDFLVVAAAGGPETRHLIDARVLQALGPRGFLVNVARGSVVDEAALTHALQSGAIAGAGLDVFEREPHVPRELFTLDNVVLAPHIASSTEQTREAMASRVLDNLEAFFAQRPLPSAVPG